MTVSERKELVLKYADINPVYAYRVAMQLPSKENDSTPELVKQIISNKAKPFVKWVGGKRQLLAQFKDEGLYPPDKFNPLTNTYFEPFVGGGAVFFDLLPKKAVLSDFNAELVTTYNIIKKDVEALIHSLNTDNYIYDKERFLEVRALPKERELSDLETAARFIYLNRTCFNGMYRVNKSGHFNVPFGAYSNPKICDEENLRRVSKSLKGVSVINQGYEKVLDKAKQGDFIYLDPPYHPVSETASFTSYTADGFTGEQQVQLRDTFLELHKRGCYVMLSNSDTKFINYIYGELAKEGIVINKVSAGRAINSNSAKRGKVQEVLVTNYRNKDMYA